MLLDAKKVYDEINEKSVLPWDQWEVLKCENERNSPESRRKAFEDVHTGTLFILAQGRFKLSYTVKPDLESQAILFL